MEMLIPGIYDSALSAGAELCGDVITFWADAQRTDMVHGASEIDRDGSRRTLMLWVGRRGLVGTWLQYNSADDDQAVDYGAVEFELHEGRWCGVWWSGDQAVGSWVLTPR